MASLLPQAFATLPHLRRRLGGFGRKTVFGGLLATVGACTPVQTETIIQSPPPMLGQIGPISSSNIVQLKAEEPVDPKSVPVKPLPINLDTVLRLAEEQNTHVAVARAQVEAAFAEKDLAAKNWLPSLNLGASYYRHEGGISNEDGSFTHSSFGNLWGGLDISSRLDVREIVYQQVNAERQIWQQKGEMRRISNETMLEAANTYLDLLAARTGESIAMALQKDLEALLARAKRLAVSEPGSRVEVARIQAQITGRQQTIMELREQAARASAKLAYLIGIDPSTPMMPADARLVPFELVKAEPPVNDLVAQALRSGPGIAEMEGLLNVIHDAEASANSPMQYMPILEMRMGEGGFGTGPGSNSQWDNRWDLALQARWNLTQLFTKNEQMRIIQAKTEQAHLAYRDLQAKLTSGVYEARESILSGKQQIKVVEDYIKEARDAMQFSQRRLDENLGTHSEMLLAINAVAVAQSTYVNVVRSYDKAQLRLMLLMGHAGQTSGPANCLLPGENRQ